MMPAAISEPIGGSRHHFLPPSGWTASSWVSERLIPDLRLPAHGSKKSAQNSDHKTYDRCDAEERIAT